MSTERSLTLAAEVALVALTLAAVAGMERLFAGGGWLGPLALNAVVAHLVASALRRRGASLATAGLVMIVAAGLVTTWTLYWHTTGAGIPTGDTWTAMRDDLDRAWTLYQDVKAPAPVETGFLLASSFAVWAIAYVADWAAFRLWVPFESTLPAGTLFLFTALLGTDRGRGWAVAVYAGALLLYLLLHRLARQEATSHWVAERRAAGHRSLLAAGSALAVVAVLSGTLIAPNLPGADSPGVLDPRDINGGNEPRVTISPLVDIRSRLVDQSNVEVFTVRSGTRAYWRLTSLERFDGRIWSSSGSYGKAGRSLPEAEHTDVQVAPIDQTYTIEALAAIWLPSAYEARSFRTKDLHVRFDDESSTLIVDSSVANSDGLTYEVTSESPRITPADLTGSAGEVPADIRSRFEGLPQGFSPRVRQLAEEVTSSSHTPYDAARALQDYLRNNYTYDLTVQPGHSDNDLEHFLFDARRGYCEQFAGAYAAMARAIGLPARVAVGFTPGDADPGDPQLFHVRGEYAHAWPEVFFAGAGWVAFEPTPGRGMPNAESYTGVPEQQAAPGRPSTATTLTQTTEAPGDTQGTTPQGTPDTRVDAGGGGGDQGGGGDSLVQRIAVDPARRVLPYVVAVMALYLIGVPALLVAHRRRRRRRATTSGQRIALAWVEAAEEAELVGFRQRPSDTHAEQAELLGETLPGAAEPAAALALARDTADYAPGGAGEADVQIAVAAAGDIGERVRAVAPWRARTLRWLDPRPPVRAWRQARRGQQRRITTTVATAEPDAERVLVGTGARLDSDAD